MVFADTIEKRLPCCDICHSRAVFLSDQTISILQSTIDDTSKELFEFIIKKRKSK